MRRLVVSRAEAAANIRRFAEEIPGSPEMQLRLGRVHDWYALERAPGDWAFAPSKFVGYKDNTIKEYLESYRKGANGGETEHALNHLSIEVKSGSRLERELISALEQFLDQWDRRPRRPSQIRVVSEDQTEATTTSANRKSETMLLDRISTDPEICGGRPCIKGTRMRVIDIVEALAHGATQQELLCDFDYLTADDIAAALLYAARASNHRVVQTA